MSQGDSDITFREVVAAKLATGITHAQAAREMNVSQSTVTGWTSGQVPRPDKLDVIAKWLEMDKEAVWAAVLRQHSEPTAEQLMDALECRQEKFETTVRQWMTKMERRLDELHEAISLLHQADEQQAAAPKRSGPKAAGRRR